MSKLSNWVAKMLLFNYYIYYACRKLSFSNELLNIR